MDQVPRPSTVWSGAAHLLAFPVLAHHHLDQQHHLWPQVCLSLLYLAISCSACKPLRPFHWKWNNKPQSAHAHAMPQSKSCSGSVITLTQAMTVKVFVSAVCTGDDQPCDLSGRRKAMVAPRNRALLWLLTNMVYRTEWWILLQIP